MILGVDMITILILTGIVWVAFVAGGLAVWLAVRKKLNDKSVVNNTRGNCL